MIDLWESRCHRDARGFALPYRLLPPPPAAGSGPHPLIIFLHGAGERGDENDAQLRLGAWRFVQDRERFPAWIIAPQCGRPYRWSEVHWGDAEPQELPVEPSLPMAALLDLVDAFLAEREIDRRRIYASGISMGGFGTWDLIARRPQLFAAAAPVCGGGDPNTAARIAGIPLWTFHGDADGAVPVQRSRVMVAALRAAGASPRYTEYPKRGHDTWVEAFREPELLPWLFAQRRG